MTIIAIDPGPTESAYVIWNGSRVVGCNILRNQQMLDSVMTIARNPAIYSDAGLVSHLAIEMVQSFGMSVGAEVFETVFWVGRFVQAWESFMPGRWAKVYRKDVKMHLCSSMRAKDPNIRQALIDRFGTVGTKREPGKLFGVKSHLWSALAVGVTWWDLNSVAAPMARAR